MKNFIIITFIFLMSLPAFGKVGGATSGGGDDLGIDAAKVVDKVIDAISVIADKLYSKEDVDNILKIKSELKIIMVDRELPAQFNNITQNGAAYSIRTNEYTVMYIVKERWNLINNLLARELLIHHELMVLSGIEVTGDYRVSLEFEKVRKNFWKLSEPKKILCSVNVFEKELIYNNLMPGKLVGSGSVSLGGMGTKSALGVLSSLPNDRILIWRAVVSTSGYFRMQIDETEFRGKPGPFQKRSEFEKTAMINLSESVMQVKEAERVYYNPYSIEDPVSNPIYFGDNYAVNVNCNKF